AAMDDLYRRHSNWLKRRLRRQFGDEADDVAHDVWRRLLSAYGNIELIRFPRALLLRIAKSSSAETGFRAARQREIAAYQANHPTGAQPHSQEAALILGETILGLPEPLRDVFVMSRIGGLSNAEIAERLGISPKTVEWRMTKALAHCAKQLR
ncbi:hypothetical protein LTR94_026873, partial [Friedmanniomyces endolithicus]